MRRTWATEFEIDTASWAMPFNIWWNINNQNDYNVLCFDFLCFEYTIYLTPIRRRFEIREVKDAD